MRGFPITTSLGSKSNTPFHGSGSPFEVCHSVFVGATARTKFLVERRRPILLLLPVRVFLRYRLFVALATLCRLLGRCAAVSIGAMYMVARPFCGRALMPPSSGAVGGPLLVVLRATLLLVSCDGAGVRRGLLCRTMSTVGMLALLALLAILGAVEMVVGGGGEGGSARASSSMASRVSVGLLF